MKKSDIPADERWLWDNPEMLSSLLNDLDENTAQRVMELKNFHALGDSSINETLYLMKSPANYAHLMESIKNVREGNVVIKDLSSGL